MILLFMRMIGANPQPEVASLRGYADAIIETRKFVWSMFRFPVFCRCAFAIG